MAIKLVVFALLLIILGSLGSALFFLVSGRGQNRSMVKALTVRIGLSLSLFLLLMLAHAIGLIKPHGL